MSEQHVIVRDPKLEKSQDYAFLRSDGLSHIERLGHELWTDYNIHDPGIAIHELFCYAITDLGYRTGYDIRDLLTKNVGGVAVSLGDFHTAGEILTAKPVTFGDLRKLLIDIHGVRNSWIAANREVVYHLDRTLAVLSDDGAAGEQALAPLNGLFDVFLEFEEFVHADPRTAHVGPRERPAAGGAFTSTGGRGIVFNVEHELTLSSVAVYAEAPGDVTVTLEDRSGGSIAAVTAAIAEADRKTTIDLGFRVPPGEGYRLRAGGTAKLHRLGPGEQGEPFPHSIEQVIYLSGGFANSPTPSGSYFFFYDWRVRYATAPVAGLRPLTRIATVGPAPDEAAPFVDPTGAPVELSAARSMALAAVTLDAEQGGEATLTLQRTGPTSAPATTAVLTVRSGAHSYALEGFEMEGGATYRLAVTAASTRLRESPVGDRPLALENVLGPLPPGPPAASTIFHALALEYPTQPHPVTVTRDDVLLAARDRLHSHRSLCQDFIDLCDLKTEEIALCADLEVRPEADVDEVMAEVFYRLGLHVSPAVTFHSLEEMLARGRTMEEIFEGPLLDHGFIDDEEFRAIQRRCEIRTSDVVRILMDVPGVEAVKSISLLRFTEGKEPVQEEWLLPLTPEEGRAPVFSPEMSKLVFYKNELPHFARWSRAEGLLKDKKASDLETKVHGYGTDVPVPVGVPRDVEEYYPAQNDLPANFMVGRRRVPESEPALRKAQSRQLTAYLLLFEQILANYLSQLAHLPQLFSWRDVDEATYYTQPVTDFAKHEDIYNEDGIRNALVAAGEAVPSRLDDALPRALRQIIESRETRLDRRNRLLDHLIARYSEDLGPYGDLLQSLMGRDAPVELIAHKRAFLKDYPALGAGRGTAHDYRRPAGPDNVAGYKRRISRLLGIDEIRSHLAGRRVVIEQTAVDGPWRFVILKDADTPGGGNVFESMTCDERGAIEALLDAVIPHGADGGNYVGKELHWVCEGDPAPTVLGAVTGAGTVAGVADYFRRIRDGEGFRIVEHVLLRKRTGDDRFMSVQLNPPGECECVEVIDPYSFRMSVLLPSWPNRFRDPRFRRFVEDTMRAEAPAHLFLKICWINHGQMQELEARLDEWSKRLAEVAGSLGVCRGTAPGRSLAGTPELPPTQPEDAPYQDSLRDLVLTLEGLVNVYPLATLYSCEDDDTEDDKPPVTLDNTSLGTL